MAYCHPISNLKTKLLHHPPVVVFFICLLVLAGAFIIIGFYSENHEIRNPDIAMDWNTMLGSLATLKFCTKINNSELLHRKEDMEPPSLLYQVAKSISNRSQINMDVVSMFLLSPLSPIGDYPHHNIINTTVLGSQLGLKGESGKQVLNISLLFNLSQRFSGSPSTQNTRIKPPVSCMKITAPRHILPQTRSPSECPVNENLEKETSTQAFIMESYEPNVHKTEPCMNLEFTPDPSLAVLLTQEEKALARYHLMLVSVLLLALCVLICLSGSLTSSRSRRHITNDTYFLKETLLE